MRYMFVAMVLGFVVLACSHEAVAQASKKLKDRPEDAQQKSWEQVDRINREGDATRSRNEQARKSAGLDKKKYTGGSVTKRHVLPERKKSETRQPDEKKHQSKKKPTPPKQ